MNKCFDTKDSTSTPERKKEFIHRWLEENVQSNAGFIDSNEQTPPSSPSLRQKNLSNEPVSPIFNRKNLESACSSSPLLGRKRLASSPIIGNRKKIFRKVRKVILNKTKEKDSKIDTSLKSTQKCDEKCNFTLSETVKLSGTHETSNTTVNEFNIKNDPKTPKIEDNVSIIESASSDDKSTENTEINVQEDYSDSDKTASDLIEEISTQLDLQSLNIESKIELSQKISNPSSASSSSNDTHISEFPTTQASLNQQPSQAATSTDFIDSISTLESKVNFSKTACILHYTNNKQKRKKNIKKGSLLDTLNTLINKERSSVNLLRHQLNKNAANIANKPFILLQVVQHLPMINDSQMLKCILIDDSTNLLRNLFKSQFITVMNLPEVSCKINDSQKPILKVFEPWTVMDPDQLLLHITRFIAIPSNDLKGFDISKNDSKANMKVIYEFNCPCIEEKELSSRCKDKDCDTKYNIANIIFNS